MKKELARRESNADRLQAFFEANPERWIQPKDGLEQAGGRYAWRSRLPKVRKRIAGEVVWNGVNGAGTAYMYRPYIPIARSHEPSGQRRLSFPVSL
jgi:hypothetical protein